MYLGIDCSGVSANLFLLAPDNREFSLQSNTPRQADVIFPLLEELLSEAEITTRDLTAIGAITGPGSFTGIRVGLALAQGLADGLGIPAYGMDAFTGMRGDDRDAIIVLESKRMELYVQYNGKIEMLPPEEIKKLSGAMLHNLGDQSFLPPSPMISMAKLAAAYAKQQHELKTPGQILSPYYVREADAKPSAA